MQDLVCNVALSKWCQPTYNFSQLKRNTGTSNTADQILNYTITLYIVSICIQQLYEIAVSKNIYHTLLKERPTNQDALAVMS